MAHHSDNQPRVPAGNPDGANGLLRIAVKQQMANQSLLPRPQTMITEPSARYMLTLWCRTIPHQEGRQFLV